MKYLSLFLFVILLSIASCKTSTSGANESQNQIDVQETRDAFNEPFRPQFHFTPPANWMNDPNGLVYHDGVYHLYYQYYPHDTKWGPMHWGHATSKDMIAWEHQPVALYPDDLGLIFSGSAVVDKNNTSGLGKDGISPLIAVFTHHHMGKERNGDNDFQYQSIAYSLDNGQTFTKYENNPVVPNDEEIRDFRDPKVFWDKEHSQWIMVFVAWDKALIYTSPNLIDWKYASEFGKKEGSKSNGGTADAPGSYGGVWECPDLFKLKVEGTEEEHWVMIVSIGNGAPNGGSGTQYFIGDFDGKRFTTSQTVPRWLDWGTDNYAGVTYNDTPDGDRVFIGWMSNWQYATVTPTKEWRSAMTIPRSLKLREFNGELTVTSEPLATLQNYEAETLTKETVDLPENFSLDGSNQYRIQFEIAKADLKDFSIVLSNKEEKMDARWDNLGELLIVNRSESGITDFHNEFRNHQHFVPTTNLDNNINIDIVLDKSSIEYFINDGQVVITEQIFPENGYTKLSFGGVESGQVKNLRINKIKSIWD